MLRYILCLITMLSYLPRVGFGLRAGSRVTSAFLSRSGEMSGALCREMNFSGSVLRMPGYKNCESDAVKMSSRLMGSSAGDVSPGANEFSPIGEGRKVPACVWPVRKPVGEEFIWDTMNTKDMFENKRVVVFSLPGAFTPTCSSQHLPKFEQLYEEIKKHNVDEVYCISVNDTFVMNAWAKALKVNKVKLIPDGNGDFTREMGLLVDKAAIGFGKRSWRYAAILAYNVVEKIFLEDPASKNPDPFEVSDAESVLKYLKKQ